MYQATPWRQISSMPEMPAPSSRTTAVGTAATKSSFAQPGLPGLVARATRMVMSSSVIGPSTVPPGVPYGQSYFSQDYASAPQSSTRIAYRSESRQPSRSWAVPRIRPSYRIPILRSTAAEATLRGSQVPKMRCRP